MSIGAVKLKFDTYSKYKKERRYDMLDSKKQKKITNMVKRHQWFKITKELNKASLEEKEAFAKEFGNVLHEQTFNYLLMLLNDSEEQVQIQAIKSLGNFESDNAKTHLQDFLINLPKEKTELDKAAREAIRQINEALAKKER